MTCKSKGTASARALNFFVLVNLEFTQKAGEDARFFVETSNS